MEFIVSNWYQIGTLIVFIGGGLVAFGAFKAKMESVVKSVQEVEAAIEQVAEKLNTHVSNPDVHVNTLLLKLFDERFDSVRKEQSETRNDVKRVEELLNKM